MLTSGYAMVVHGRPKTPKNKFFFGGGSPSPKGSYSPYILGDTTRPGHVTRVLVWSKSDRRRLRKTLHKQTNKQTNRQTNRQYENNDHLAVNQYYTTTPHFVFCLLIFVSDIAVLVLKRTLNPNQPTSRLVIETVYSLILLQHKYTGVSNKSSPMRERCERIIIPPGRNAFHRCWCRRNTKQPILGPKKGMQRNVILAHREVRMFILSEIWFCSLSIS